MPPQMRVSAETRALIDPKEMDAQLDRLRDRMIESPVFRMNPRREPLRIQSMNVTQENFIYGTGDSMLDAACDLLSANLRPVPPQPNCPQSMQIFEHHRHMAAEYVRVKQELSELRRCKQELQDKIAMDEIDTLTPEKAREYNQLKSEKEALLAFRSKLAEQLQLIEAAQNENKSAGSLPSSHSSAEDWVIVKEKEDS